MPAGGKTFRSAPPQIPHAVSGPSLICWTTPRRGPPAARLGTRCRPATKAEPKEMLRVGDKPSIQYVVEEAVRAGLTDILIITGRNKRAIEDHFDPTFELE